VGDSDFGIHWYCIGLSHAIGGMNFANVDDVDAIMGSINAVTGGLGTAFDADPPRPCPRDDAQLPVEYDGEG